VLATREAQKTGQYTLKLIETLLDGNQPLRYLRRIQGILRLKKTNTVAAIEYGCQQALRFERMRLAYITDCAKKFDLGGTRPRVIGAPERELSSVYLQSIKLETEENHLL
jgi:hypothetical protein